MSEGRRADYRLVPLGKQHTRGMLQIFNQHVNEGFAAYPETSVSEDVMDTLLAQTAGFPTVAVESADGSFLGFGFLRAYSPQSTFSHTAQITYFLDPAFVRRGIGTAVLRYLEDGAREQGITKILAHVSSRNPASLSFHVKHGFAECGRLPGIGRKWGESFDVVWMVKSLVEDDAA